MGCRLVLGPLGLYGTCFQALASAVCCTSCDMCKQGAEVATSKFQFQHNTGWLEGGTRCGWGRSGRGVMQAERKESCVMHRAVG
jgi:hypothetical protein